MDKQKDQTKKVNNRMFRYPEEILKPVKDFLNERLMGLEKQRKEISAADPIRDKSRLTDNAAMDDDAAEQVGHLQANALKSSLDRKIIQVRKALSMMKIGRYGICENCGNMIDTDRLVVMPETTLCINCEKKREK